MAWVFGSFRLDPERFQLCRGNVPVEVEPQVLALLIQLVTHRARLVTKDEIAEHVWQGRIVSDASISSRIRSARQAVGDDGQLQSTILTVHGKGFRFVADVLETGAPQVLAQTPATGAIPEAMQTGRPSIAILRFRPLTMTPDLAILAEAIPCEII